MWLWLAAPTVMAATLHSLWGPWAVGAFLGQAVGSVMLLEAVNYVEHYGLARRRLPSGRWGVWAGGGDGLQGRGVEAQ